MGRVIPVTVYIYNKFSLHSKYLIIGETESKDAEYEKEILHQRNQDLLATLFGSSAVIVGKEDSKGNLPRIW